MSSQADPKSSFDAAVFSAKRQGSIPRSIGYGRDDSDVKLLWHRTNGPPASHDSDEELGAVVARICWRRGRCIREGFMDRVTLLGAVEPPALIPWRTTIRRPLHGIQQQPTLGATRVRCDHCGSGPVADHRAWLAGALSGPRPFQQNFPSLSRSLSLPHDGPGRSRRAVTGSPATWARTRRQSGYRSSGSARIIDILILEHV
ncbi:hypothetical protein V8E36_007265 [Tilletia maclaganii]